MKTEDFLDLLNEVDDKYIQELYEETVLSEPAKKRSRTSIKWTRWAGIAAAFALLMIGSVIAFKYKTAPTVIVPETSQHLSDSSDSSVVYTEDGTQAVILDVNPSIELKIDQETATIKELIPLNKDAEEILTSKLLTTNKVGECLAQILDEFSDFSYITPTSNSILVTVVNGEETQAQQLSDLVVSSLQDAASKSNMSLSILTQHLSEPEDFDDLAAQNQISVGKAALISSITDNMSMDEFDYSELACMNIQALNQIADYVDATVNRIGSLAGDINEEQKNLLGIAAMDFSSALELAQELSETYAQLVSANPTANDPINYCRSITMEQNANSNGTMVWSLVIRDPLSGSSSPVVFGISGDEVPPRTTGHLRQAVQGFFDFWSSFLPR